MFPTSGDKLTRRARRMITEARHRDNDKQPADAYRSAWLGVARRGSSPLLASAGPPQPTPPRQRLAMPARAGKTYQTAQSRPGGIGAAEKPRAPTLRKLRRAAWSPMNRAGHVPPESSSRGLGPPGGAPAGPTPPQPPAWRDSGAPSGHLSTHRPGRQAQWSGDAFEDVGLPAGGPHHVIDAVESGRPLR